MRGFIGICGYEGKEEKALGFGAGAERFDYVPSYSYSMICTFVIDNPFCDVI